MSEVPLYLFRAHQIPLYCIYYSLYGKIEQLFSLWKDRILYGKIELQAVAGAVISELELAERYFISKRDW